jgi:hypothetical protein
VRSLTSSSTMSTFSWLIDGGMPSGHYCGSMLYAASGSERGKKCRLALWSQDEILRLGQR